MDVFEALRGMEWTESQKVRGEFQCGSHGLARVAGHQGDGATRVGE